MRLTKSYGAPRHDILEAISIVDSDIVVCSNEKHIMRLVEVNLNRVGYRVTCSPLSEEAIAVTRSIVPDLIILDTDVPDKRATGILSNMRSCFDSHIVVVMLIARDEYEDIREVWRAGVDCLLVKPFDPNNLIRYVDRLVHPSEVGYTEFDSWAPRMDFGCKG